tara:strand:+ start:29 stop:2719 length:2691 start_codon:yes stop_codon:yes gene_type:complete
MAEGDNTNTPEQESEVTEQKKEQLKILQDLNSAIEKQVRYETRRARMRGEEISNTQTLVNLHGQQAEVQRELLDIALAKTTDVEKLSDLTQKHINMINVEVEKGRMIAENGEAQKAIANEILNLKREILQNTEEDNTQQVEKLKLLTQELNKQQEISKAQEAGTRAGANLVNSLGSMIGFKPNPAFNDFFQSLTTSEGAAAGVGSAFRGIASQAGEVFSLGNVLGFVAENLFELGVAFDEVTSSVTAATGASREYASQLAAVASQNAKLGITFQETGQAQIALLSDFQHFSELLDENGNRNVDLQNKITATASQLSMLGVNASTTAGNLNFLVTSLGLTAEQADTTFRTMIEQGANLNIPPDQLAQAFQTLQPRLALFGKRAPDIFQRTAAAAKSLGLSVADMGSSLFALSDGFDEFDEAAGKVAAANLILGGSFVSSYEMVMAAAEGPFAQLELLRDGFDRAGRSLGDMPFFEKQMMAKNFGMEIDTLTALIDGEIKSQEELNAMQAENSKSIEDMVRDATPMLKDLQASLQNIFGDLSSILGPVANIINGLSSALGNGLAPVLMGIATFSGLKFISFFTKGRKAAEEQAEAIKDLVSEMKNLQKHQQIAGLQAQMEEAKSLARADLLTKASQGAIELEGDTVAARLESIEALAGESEAVVGLKNQLDALTTVQDDSTDGSKKQSIGMGELTDAFGAATASFGMTMGVLEMFPASMQKGAAAAAMALGAVAIGVAAVKGAAAGPAGLFLAAAGAGALLAGIMKFVSAGDEAGTGAGGVTDIGALGETGGFNISDGVDDAIIQRSGNGTNITPIHSSDQLIAAKPGGPVARANGGNLGGGSQIPERLIAALETLAAGMRGPQSTGGSGAVNVTIELDKRKMGQAVVDIMNKEMSLT